MADGPLIVYIIRHGEKLGDPSRDDEAIRDLSIRGSARAAAIPSLFAPATTPTTELSCELAAGTTEYDGTYHENPLTTSPPPQRLFATPDFLFATANSHNSQRPIETITPLSAALQLQINPGLPEPFREKDHAALATYLLSKSTFTGKVVLICWHHGTIPDLAKELNAPANQISKWNGAVFDRVWEIKYGTEPPTFHDFPQQLLYGDSAN